MFPKFREVWAVDFEFTAPPGWRPSPACLVAKELRSGRTLRLWRNQFGNVPPYPTDESVLFVAYYASAEVNCHRALGWPVPARILDLFTEFRAHRNGAPGKAGLLQALVHYGLPAIGALEKESMRQLAMRGGPWTAQEQEDLLEYCEGDVIALERLLLVMAPKIDLNRALLRGRYMRAVSAIEHTGVPIDMERLTQLKDNWESIKAQLIAEIDKAFGVYDGQTFKLCKFEAYLQRNHFWWPTLHTGQLDLRGDTFREMSKIYPQIAPLHELRDTLGQLRLISLEVGPDGRNRTMLSAFASRTGRNQPSNSKLISARAHGFEV